jgi:hypothetical protein
MTFEDFFAAAAGKPACNRHRRRFVCGGHNDRWEGECLSMIENGHAIRAEFRKTVRVSDRHASKGN